MLSIRSRSGWANAGFGQSGKDGWAGRKRGALPSQIFRHLVPPDEKAVSGAGDRSIKVLNANARR
jgi:hypothetical protein